MNLQESRQRFDRKYSLLRSAYEAGDSRTLSFLASAIQAGEVLKAQLTKAKVFIMCDSDANRFDDLARMKGDLAIAHDGMYTDSDDERPTTPCPPPTEATFTVTRGGTLAQRVGEALEHIEQAQQELGHRCPIILELANQVLRSGLEAFEAGSDA